MGGQGESEWIRIMRTEESEGENEKLRDRIET